MSEAVDVESLSELIPIKELGVANQAKLGTTAQLIELPAGQELSAAKEQSWIIYLLEGELALVSAGRAAVHIAAGSARARLPLFYDRAGNDVATATTRCVLVRLEKELFSDLLSQQQLSASQFSADASVG